MDKMANIANLPDFEEIEIGESSDDDSNTDKHEKSMWDPSSDFPTPSQDLDSAIGFFGTEAILGTPDKPVKYTDGYVPTFIVSLTRQFYIDNGCDIRKYTAQDIAKEIKKSLIGFGFHIRSDCSDSDLSGSLMALLDFYGIEYKH